MQENNELQMNTDNELQTNVAEQAPVCLLYTSDAADE